MLVATSRNTEEISLRQYDGCELVLLKACRVPAKYDYTSVTPKNDHVSIRTDDDLWATLPIGAAKMEGMLQQSGQLNVDMLLVGSYRMDRDWLNHGELRVGTVLLLSSDSGPERVGTGFLYPSIRRDVETLRTQVSW